MKVVLFLAFIGIVSAGKLRHGQHSSHGRTRPGRPDSRSGVGPSPGQFGGSGQGVGPRPGQFGGSGQGVGPSPGQFGGSGQGVVPRPGQGQTGGTSPSGQQLVFEASLNGIVTFDNHACIFRNGELSFVGPLLQIGENGDYSVQAGTATLGTGETVSVDSGLLNTRLLPSRDSQELQNSLARAGTTLDLFIQQTGTIPPQQGIYDVTAGVLSINGVLKNIRAGVFVAVASQITDPVTGAPVQREPTPETCPQPLCVCTNGLTPVLQEQEFGCPTCGCVAVQPEPIPEVCPELPRCACLPGLRVVVQEDETGCPACGCEFGTEPGFDSVQTVTLTETAAHVTETVSQPVTLTKTQTQDEFVTITSPVYNSEAATITNLQKQTVTVPEDQVIRSPVAGSVIVNTIPVPSQTALTVRVRSTNMFIRTITADVTNDHTHYVTNYSISTATVNNPVTSTVVETISQTQVSTVYNTSTMRSTLFTTITSTVNIGAAGGNQHEFVGTY